MDKHIISLLTLDEIINGVRQAVREEMASQPYKDDSTVIEKPLTTKQLCKFLEITEPTVILWRKKGKIPFFRIGSSIRFDKNAVLKSLGK